MVCQKPYAFLVLHDRRESSRSRPEHVLRLRVVVLVRLAVPRHDARRELKRDRLLHDRVQQDQGLRARQRVADCLARLQERVENAGALERLQQQERERVRVRAAACGDSPIRQPQDALPGPADGVRDYGADEAPERDDPDVAECCGGKLRPHLLDDEAGEEERGAELGNVPDGLVVEVVSTRHDVPCEEGEEDGDGALEGADERVDECSDAGRHGRQRHLHSAWGQRASIQQFAVKSCLVVCTPAGGSLFWYTPRDRGR